MLKQINNLSWASLGLNYQPTDSNKVERNLEKARTLNQVPVILPKLGTFLPVQIWDPSPSHTFGPGALPLSVF